MVRRWVLGMQAAVLLMAQAVGAESVGDVFHRVNASVAVIRARWSEARGSGELTKVSEVGSGFLISRDGRMITAAHLVQIADEITAEFLTGEEVPARVVASEPAADLALLQVERVPPQTLVASLGDSAKARVGDDVFIIGAPYGIGHTLSIGHVSARFRPGTVYSEVALAEFLQTDAAINPGNSGGPMFNIAGEVIGVASHNISKSGGFEGLGFVVTINMAKRLLLEERSHWSGLSGVLLTGSLAKALNLPGSAGILVQQVAANSPAARIGLRPGTIQATIGGQTLLLGGDVILAVLGVPISEESYEQRRWWLPVSGWALAGVPMPYSTPQLGHGDLGQQVVHDLVTDQLVVRQVHDVDHEVEQLLAAVLGERLHAGFDGHGLVRRATFQPMMSHNV